MSYASSNNPGNTPENKPSTSAPKDSKNLIIAVLAVALIGSLGYLFFANSKSNEQITTLTEQKDDSDSARVSLQTEYEDILRRNDSLAGSNVQLQGELAVKQQEIESKKAEIRKELSRKNGDISKARRLINELKGQVNDLLAQVQQLTEQNGQLTTANEQLNVEKTQLSTEKAAVEQNLASTTADRDRLNDVASTLHASNINIAAIDVRSNGREKESTTAKRIDQLKVSFQLDENRIAPSGAKDLYVVVVAPDGKIISSTTNGSGQFNTRDEGEKTFTTRVNSNYEQGRITPVSFNYRQENRFQEGQYKVEIYHNGFKIGEGYKTLKKGGLFS